MDTAIALIIVAVAAVYVFRRMRRNMSGKSSCGCGSDCGSCCGNDSNESCSSQKDAPLK